MNPTTHETTSVVPTEEVARRIAEYRHLGFEHRAPAHIVYSEPNQVCPWPGCGYRIAAIGFQLETMGEPSFLTPWLEAWWQGPGLVGRCPGCGQMVLFGMLDKQRVTDPTASPSAVLPEDWHHKAYLVPQSGK